MSSVHGLRLFRQIEICVLRHGSVSGALRRAPPASSGFVRSHRGQHLTPARWLSGSAAQSVQSVALRLNCQVGFIPHPEKAHKGGEDAFFVLTHDAGHGSGCGVADGVGGWAEQGVDSGEYSRALMKEAHRHLEEQLSTSSGTGGAHQP
ncbi:hypothetical protein T484DRAFT_1761125 [Baffinella frigidus]|nr:hypothetical protein T484DRAFT_1761125 [Cryptophyta sp. CCMP2293]